MSQSKYINLVFLRNCLGILIYAKERTNRFRFFLRNCLGILIYAKERTNRCRIFRNCLGILIHAKSEQMNLLENYKKRPFQKKSNWFILLFSIKSQDNFALPPRCFKTKKKNQNRLLCLSLDKIRSMESSSIRACFKPAPTSKIQLFTSLDSTSRLINVLRSIDWVA